MSEPAIVWVSISGSPKCITEQLNLLERDETVSRFIIDSSVRMGDDHLTLIVKTIRVVPELNSQEQPDLTDDGDEANDDIEILDLGMDIPRL